MAKGKKDFDKEYIFNLIMPSAPMQSTDDEPDGALVDLLESDSKPDESSVTLPPAEEAEIRDSLSLLKDRLRARSPGIQLKNGCDLVLVNLMETLVVERLDDAFGKFNCCKCDKCRHDVAAIALNLLPPRYIVSTPDVLHNIIEESSTREISAALVKAILYVKGHPRH